MVVISHFGLQITKDGEREQEYGRKEREDEICN